MEHLHQTEEVNMMMNRAVKCRQLALLYQDYAAVVLHSNKDISHLIQLSLQQFQSLYTLCSTMFSKKHWYSQIIHSVIQSFLSENNSSSTPVNFL